MTPYTPLLQLLESYQTTFAEESGFVDRFFELLIHPRAYHRDHLPGHITGSAWVVNESRSKILLLHHKKLNRWLQPGGHADGDANVLQVAMRELEEETGIRNAKLLTLRIFDLDIHPIPSRKDFPEHFHYDVRFWFEADEADKIIESDESHEVKWIEINELNRFTDNESIHRMVRKSFEGSRSL